MLETQNSITQTKVSPHDIESAIERGMDFMYRNQLPTGLFKTYYCTSPDPLMEEGYLDTTSVFTTALITYCLSFFSCQKTKEMTEKAIQHFLSRMEDKGLWRYGCNHEIYIYKDSLPPDADDTACISYILKQNNISFPDNRKLLLANRNEQGLFYLWIWPKLKFVYIGYGKFILKEFLRLILSKEIFRIKHRYIMWKIFRPYDIDGVVNANILMYIGNNELTEPVIQYLIRIIHENREETCDQWYFNRFMFYYAVSRNIHANIEGFESIQIIIIDRIRSLAKKNGMIGKNPLDTALAVCSLINLKSFPPEIHNAIRALLNEQQEQGEWKRYFVYYNGSVFRRGNINSSGYSSEELTTGFCLEALTRYFNNLYS